MAIQKINNTQQLNTVLTQANAGTAGGNIYYINLGGIKMAWGTSANQNTNTSGISYTVTLPTSFFSTIQSVTAIAANMTSDGRQYISVSSFTTTTVTFNYIVAASTATTAASWVVIGT